MKISPSGKLHHLVISAWFQNTITGVILAAGVVVGLETSPWIVDRYGSSLKVIDSIIIVIFSLEIIIKIGAFGNRPWDYFRSGWNVFDFTIVLLCILPLNAQFVAVLRLARILRVLRLVTVLPRLQILVGALLKSLPSMGYVGLLLFLHFYMYAVVGTFLFGRNDPLHFGSLGKSLLSLFQVVTLEGWVDLMKIQMVGTPQSIYDGAKQLMQESEAYPIGAPVFFLSFIIVGGMIILNLFIGVIMNSMQESHAEHQATLKQKEGYASVEANDIRSIELQLDQVISQLAVLRHRIHN